MGSYSEGINQVFKDTKDVLKEEPKFKVEDKVICRDTGENTSCVLDEVGEVQNVIGRSPYGGVAYVVDFDGNYQTCYERLDGMELAVSQDNVNNPQHYVTHCVNSDGGPTSYYDFLPDWKTWNDLADYKAQNQWKEHSFHLGNVGKAIYRWGEKEGTTKSYDARKIVYSGLRVLMMLEGQASVQEYLKELREDPQFK